MPYAAAPTGDRRFRPPEAPRPWVGVREATTFSEAAPQPPSPLLAILGSQDGGWNEDCLYLNVFAPAQPGGGLPVMVWIHGGAFIGGSGSSRWYDGDRFAAEGNVVVVTLNYRLGILGFLELGDTYPGAGNCGLLDQLAALRWVQDNIASFGGDPDQVTVFGESAGAMSIALMLTMPGARGLFHRAIVQSGSTTAYRTPEDAAQVTADVLAVFGGSLESLWAAPVEKLLEAQTLVTGGSDATAYLSFRPVVDGTHIPLPPDQAITSGLGLDVPLLVGTNRDEMSVFFAFDPAMAALTEEQLGEQAAALIGAERWTRMAAHYRSRFPERNSAALMSAMTTDLVFRIPSLLLAEAMSGPGRRAPVWMYRLDWESPAFGGLLGAPHAMDIPFVWDLTEVPGVEMFTGEAPGRHELGKAMHAAWLAFAKGGVPETPLLPAWPTYEAPQRATMLFDAECRVVEDPNGAERELWEGPA